MCCFIRIVTCFIVGRWVVLLDEKYKEGIFSFLKLSNNFVKELLYRYEGLQNWLLLLNYAITIKYITKITAVDRSSIDYG